MKIRLEFTDRKGSHFPWALRLARKMPTFRQTIEDGMNIYSVEFDPAKDRRPMEGLGHYFGHWKQSAWYVDGQLTNLGEIMRQLYNADRAKARAIKGDPRDFINGL